MKTYIQFQEDLNKSINTAIKTGVTSFLDKNKNVSVGDFLNKNKRKETINKLKTSAIKTGGNVLSNIGSSMSQYQTS